MRPPATTKSAESELLSEGGDAVGSAEPRRTVPPRTRRAKRLATGAVLAARNVVEARLVGVKVRVIVVRPISGKREDGSDDRRRDRSAAEDEPAAFTIGIVDGDAGIRIGIGRRVGLRTVRTAGVEVVLKAGLCIDRTATAPGERPRGLRAGAVGRERRSADGSHGWENRGPLRGFVVAVVSGRRGDCDTGDVEVAVVRLRTLVAAPAIADVVRVARCVLFGAREIGGVVVGRFNE